MSAPTCAVAEELKKNGYSFVRFTPNHGLIENIMGGWRKYLAMPAEERIRWRVGNPLDWDDGYVFKDGTNGSDHKHFFHYRPHLFALLEHAGVDYEGQGQLEWLLHMNELWYYCHHHFMEIMNSLDECMEGFHFVHKFCSPVAKAQHVLRLLSYNERLVPGQQLGKPHMDKNFGTFQVFETHPALVLELPGKQVRYEPQAGKALVFTSAKAQQYTNGALRAVKHSVIVPDDFIPQEGVSRQSIVFFAHIHL